MAMTHVSDLVRYEGEPRVIETGPSSLSTADQLARMLGWFSIGLGLAEIVAPGRITRALGLEGSESFVRACGVREIGAGVLCLSVDKEMGLWSRVAGDAVDLAALVPAMGEDNPQRGNAGMAMAMVAGAMLLDALTAQAVRQQHKQSNGMSRDYHDRSGFPRGVEAARGAARLVSTHLGKGETQPELSHSTQAAGRTEPRYP